ncbi:MAG: LysM peptidoglycan-binding domain-containing protein [Bacteroidia bacterium]|nr:LysM peptidoglycan-binding domain-containing protein [Bacteroidia bacterium]
MSEDPKKLILVAFSDEKFKSEVSRYSVSLNPTSIKLNRQVNYAEDSPLGASGTDLKYRFHIPASLQFSIMMDSTGVIPNSPKDLEGELKKIKSVLMDYNGDIHEPQYVVVSWGTLSFQGRATSLDVTYQQFHEDGTPFRMELAFTFRESISDEIRNSLEGKNSPDLTHERLVQAGDTLPKLTNDIYGDPSYYIEVAKANGLNNFRHLVPGTILYFPPLAKSAE